MTIYLSNRDGNGKTSEEGHYKFQTGVWLGNVLGSTDLAVSQNSPTGMSVLVAAGQYKIDTTSQYSYTGWNTANAAVAITTADPANPRITSIVLYVDKTASTSASPPNNPGIAKLIAVNGTPAASPSAPNSTTIQTAVGAGNPYIVLANVTVPTGATSIVNANISDQRVQVTLSANTVNATSLQSNSVSTAKIQDSAITTAKIADANITTAKLADGSIDDSKWRNTVCFSAQRTSTLNLGAATFGKFSCNTILYNVGSGYSNTSDIGRFTAPVTGIYQFNARLNASASTNVRALIELRINGSGSAQYPRDADITGPSGTVIRNVNTSRMFFLNAGDYVEAWAWCTVATNIASGAGQPEQGTQFEGYLVTRT